MRRKEREVERGGKRAGGATNSPQAPAPSASLGVSLSPHPDTQTQHPNPGQGTIPMIPALPGHSAATFQHWEKLRMALEAFGGKIQLFPGQTTGMFSATPSTLSPVRVTQLGHKSSCDKPCPPSQLSQFLSCPSPATIPFHCTRRG